MSLHGWFVQENEQFGSRSVFMASPIKAQGLGVNGSRLSEPEVGPSDPASSPRVTVSSPRARVSKRVSGFSHVQRFFGHGHVVPAGAPAAQGSYSGHGDNDKLSRNRGRSEQFSRCLLQMKSTKSLSCHNRFGFVGCSVAAPAAHSISI